MALQFVVDSLDAVPETLRDMYQQDGDKFRLQVDGYEDPAGLKSALEKERKAAREAAKQAAAWSHLGKSPDEIAALVEAQRKADEDKLKGSGEWDKLKQQMQEQAQKEREKLESSLKSKDAAIERYLIDAQATAAISELKGVAALLLPHVKASVRVVDDSGEYAIRVVDAGGNPRVNANGEYLTIKDLVSEMRQSEVYGRAFEASGTSGGGATGNGSGVGHKKYDASKLGGTRAERAAALAARFPELAKGA